ncbi:hypothetical protein KSP39_PZI000194 [Platanthera zijinensis]|uniref:PetM of cytochrome b6/f complex subunit 7 n=1 Tax=Platanthera zijinensis TaxID=2320716 RepID=A0AAP0GFG7_9ASPA
MAVIHPLNFPAAAAAAATRKAGVTYIQGLGSFGGLKAQNSVTSLGVSGCADKSFGLVMKSVRARKTAEKSRGGAMSSTCNAAAEIFKIAAIMNGLTLVGVAVGFVLLRVEAAFEEDE